MKPSCLPANKHKNVSTKEAAIKTMGMIAEHRILDDRVYSFVWQMRFGRCSCSRREGSSEEWIVAVQVTSLPNMRANNSKTKKPKGSLDFYFRVRQSQDYISAA